MLFTDVQRSVRLNKKEKSPPTLPLIPDEAIDRLARAFYPAILCLLEQRRRAKENLPRGRREQAHLGKKKNRAFPTGNAPVVHIAYRMWIFQGVRPGGRTLFLFCL